MKRARFVSGTILAVILTLFAGRLASAATITVTSLADSGPGSLRDAIASASPGDTINFSVAGTITLTSGTLEVTRDLTIVGPGASSMAVDGNNAFGVLLIDAGTTVAISGLTIQNGFAVEDGGGILNHGTLTLTKSTLSRNSTGGSGGFFGGGGIYNDETISVSDSTLSHNNSGLGGAILNVHGRATLTNVVLSSNWAYYLGGAIFNGCGSQPWCYGMFGALTITNGTVSGNETNFDGAGIYSDINGGTLTVSNSTFSGNDSRFGYGGGIRMEGGTLVVTNSTFIGNSSGEDGGGQGGGIAIVNGATATLVNSTVSGNIASFQGGGIWSDATLTVKNTIVASNPNGGNCSSSGTFTSQGHNLSDDTTCSTFFTGPGDMNDTPAGLDPGGLRDNGGPTQTIALLATSPAVDAVPVSPTNYCTAIDGTKSITTDQRGVKRPQGPACDVGAFELAESVNQPPIARVGQDRTVECTGYNCATVTLNGSASSDPDGDALTFKWTDPANNVVGTAATATVTAPMGTTAYTLTVTDPGGLSSSATTHITVQDTTPPVLTLSQTSMTVVLPTASASGATVNLSGIATATDTCDPSPTITNNAPSLFTAGTTIVTFTATDHSGNQSEKNFSVRVVYNFNGYFMPILNNGASLFQSGRTVPVKFTLMAADGTIITNAVANLQVYFVLTTPTGTVDETVDTLASGSSNIGTLFRFDAGSGQYIYNLSTSGFATGTYLLRTTLNDGTTHDAYFSIR